MPYISIGDARTAPSLQAQNLGFYYSSMTLQPHISNTYCLSSFHIRNIGKIRKVTHAFVTFHLDIGNVLLDSLPSKQISRNAS